MSLMYTAEERVDRLTEEERYRKARRLAWLGVVYLFLAALLAPLHYAPAVGIGGAGILNLGTALLASNQRKTGARVLLVVGAATVVTGIILTITELVRFFQR
ncbi:hypothetical protein [Pseudarthrobacter sp. fls2-241-R2A-168]|uniref:hypothetical protein n=1 Tax=Pseudarthrobacter sp. fls2-241-R2A-168 TaxID=3040304 RepID=UPI0025529E0C|nr:hypothetical protein [Pseudarthrobacter sp. fls2-241-R2A-168]